MGLVGVEGTTDVNEEDSCVGLLSVIGLLPVKVFIEMMMMMIVMMVVLLL